jgi:hypothetical protein
MLNITGNTINVAIYNYLGNDTDICIITDTTAHLFKLEEQIEAPFQINNYLPLELTDINGGVLDTNEYSHMHIFANNNVWSYDFYEELFRPMVLFNS